MSDIESNEQLAAERHHTAKQIVSKYMGWGVGAGVVPMPFWDIVAVGSVQVLMLKELYALYGIRFSEKKARSTVSILLGTASPRLLLGVTATSMLKFVPVLGHSLATFSMPILASASTYAVGSLMVSHLEKGGTQDNFDVANQKQAFKETLEKGKQMAKNAKDSVKSAVSSKAEPAATGA